MNNTKEYLTGFMICHHKLFVHCSPGIWMRYWDTLFVKVVREQFIYIDDNARPNEANIFNNWFEQTGIDRIDWPANSLKVILSNIVGICWKRRIYTPILAPYSFTEFNFLLERVNPVHFELQVTWLWLPWG